MKKMMMSAMMIMAMMCFTANVSAQDNADKKEKKECCDKHQGTKDCCDKQQEKKACCKQEAKAKDCKKCGECKPECGDKGCKECPNNHKCKKGCKK